MAIKHKFTSPKADSGDTTIVRPSNWNADHDAPEVDALIQMGNDIESSGLISGGDLSINTTVTQLNISAGVGYLKVGGVYTPIIWGAYSGIEHVGNTYNYVAINSDGSYNVSLTKQSLDDHIYLGCLFFSQGANRFNVVWKTPEWVGNYAQRNNSFVREIFKTLVKDYNSFIVTEQVAPDNLKLNTSAGSMYIALTELTYTAKTTLTKLYKASDYGITPNYTNPNQVDVQYWNDITRDHTTCLIAMSTGYWKKDIVIMNAYGTVYVVYSTAEYATEDLAKAAPLPSWYQDLINDGNAILYTLVSQQGDTSIANRLSDIRPIFSEIFYKLLGTGVFDYNDLINKPDHNDLSNIQGGQVAERYHLDVDKYNNITAGSYQFSSAVIQNIALSGANTAGVMTSISSGNMYMAGGNNITLSQNGNSITISGPNAGGAQTGISGIAGSAASTVTAGTVQFANSNGISFGLNSVTMTASHNAVMTSASSLLQHTSATSAITASALNTSQSSLFQHTSATSNNTSLAMNTSERARFVSKWSFVGAQTAGTSTQNISDNVIYISAGNMMTLSGNASTIVFSMNPASLLNTSQSSLFQHTSATSAITASAMNTSERASILSTSQSSLFQHTSATSAITANALNTSQSSLFQHTSATSAITASAMNTSERASLQYTSANTIFIRGMGASNTTYNTGTIIFSGVNATINTSLNGASQYIGVSVAAPGAAAENNWFNLLGANTAGNTTASGSTIGLSGGNNVTLSGTNNSQIIISVPNLSYLTAGTNITLSSSSNSIGIIGGGGGGGVAIAGSAASTVTAGTVQFINGNGVSFGLNSVSMTASTANASLVSYWSLVGNNTAGSTTRNITNNIIYFSGGNNVTLSGNNDTIIISGGAGAGGGITYSMWEPLPINNVTGTMQSNGTVFVYPVSVDQYVTATRGEFVCSVMQSVNATLSNSARLSLGVVIYTLNNNSYQINSVSSATTEHHNGSIGSGSSANSVSYTGQIIYSIPININMTPGLYWIGLWSRSTVTSASATNNNQNMTMYGIVARTTNWSARNPGVSNNSAASSLLQVPQGFVTVSRSQTDLSSPVWIANSTAAGATTRGHIGQASRMPYIIFQQFTFPRITV
jgi:hypothetical protein